MIRSVELCDEIRCKNDFDWLFVTTNLDPGVYYGMVFDYSILDYVSTMFVVEDVYATREFAGTTHPVSEVVDIPRTLYSQCEGCGFFCTVSYCESLSGCAFVDTGVTRFFGDCVDSESLVSSIAVSQEDFGFISRRIFSSQNPVGSEFNVDLVVDIFNEPFYVIEEHLPVGWIVVDSGGGNTNTPNQIKWVVYGGQLLDTVYTYRVRTPSLGTYTIEGVYTIGSTEVKTISGDSVVVVESLCGNGDIDSGEECDDGCLTGIQNVCEDVDNGDGCSSICRSEISECSNGIREFDEECDGSDLNQQTCASLGYDTGTLSCTSTCSLDTSQCIVTSCSNCGAGLLNVCDRVECENIGVCYYIDTLTSGVCTSCSGATCENYNGDETSCSDDTCGLTNCLWDLNTNSCYEGYCSDGRVSGTEVCDSDSISCTQGGYSGTKACLSDCSGYGPCQLTELCGDGIIQVGTGEVCDDNNIINGDGCSMLCENLCSYTDYSLSSIGVIGVKKSAIVNSKHIEIGDVLFTSENPQRVQVVLGVKDVATGVTIGNVANMFVGETKDIGGLRISLLEAAVADKSVKIDVLKGAQGTCSPVCGNGVTENNPNDALTNEVCDIVDPNKYAIACLTTTGEPGLNYCKGNCLGYNNLCQQSCGDLVCQGETTVFKGLETCSNCPTDCGTCGSTYIPPIEYPQPAPGTPLTCFLENTPILTLSGEEMIQDISIGDFVMSYNEETGKLEESKVLNTFEHITDSYLVINNKLRVTPNHPMHINGKWEEIGKAKVGDTMRTFDGKEEIINSIEKIKEKERVYNLEVEGNNNYYAEGVLVHNKAKQILPE